MAYCFSWAFYVASCHLQKKRFYLFLVMSSYFHFSLCCSVVSQWASWLHIVIWQPKRNGKQPRCLTSYVLCYICNSSNPSFQHKIELFVISKYFIFHCSAPPYRAVGRPVLSAVNFENLQHVLVFVFHLPCLTPDPDFSDQIYLFLTLHHGNTPTPLYSSDSS